MATRAQAQAQRQATQAAAPAISEESGFWAKVDQWKTKTAEFFKVYEALQGARPVVTAAGDPELADAYAQQMSRGSILQSTIQTVEETVDSVRAKLQQAADVFDGNLGIAPLVLLGAVGVITGGLAALGYWLSSSYDLMKRIQAEASRQDTYERLRAQGMTHAQALQVIATTKLEPPSSWVDRLGTVAVLLLVGGLVWWLQRGKA